MELNQCFCEIILASVSDAWAVHWRSPRKSPIIRQWLRYISMKTSDCFPIWPTAPHLTLWIHISCVLVSNCSMFHCQPGYTMLLNKPIDSECNFSTFLLTSKPPPLPLPQKAILVEEKPLRHEHLHHPIIQVKNDRWINLLKMHLPVLLQSK